ncbi:MAG: PepSY domain-containing protein [Bryobacteraceae bacterium]
MSAEAPSKYNSCCIVNGGAHFALPRWNRLALFLLCLALLISLSCSTKENTAASGSKQPAKKTASPPSGAMTLSAVLSHLESAHYAPVTEVEFEKDHWEIKAYSNGQLLQLQVNPLTGAIVPNPPPTIEKPLSAVVKGLEDQGYGPILDIEHGSNGDANGAAWEVEAYKGSSEVTVNVEAASGKVTAK